MDPEIARYNERYRALATFCDNAALAVFAASVARLFNAQPWSFVLADLTFDGSGLLIVLGVMLGVAFLRGGWHIRGFIQSED